MDKKRLTIAIIAGTLLVTGLTGIGLGVYFIGTSKNRIINNRIESISLDTFYKYNRDEARIKWEIDTLDYNVKSVNTRDYGYLVSFNVDNPQGFYDDCIKPYISSSLVEYTINTQTIRLFFYDKAPIYYTQDENSISLQSYGSELSDYLFLTPFFSKPSDVTRDTETTTFYYRSKGSTGLRYDLFGSEVFKYNIKLENFDDAKNLFETHLDPKSYLVNAKEKSITTYAYKIVEYNYVDDDKRYYYDFDKNVYAKYIFNEEDILLTCYNCN